MFGTPPIRPLSFDEVLDDIVAEARPGTSESLGAGRPIQPDMDWFFQLLALAAKSEAAKPEPAGRGVGAAGNTGSLFYGDEIRDVAAPRDDEEAVAAELALSRVGSLAELKRIRRDFALRNHPDMLHPAVQAWATRRMTIANMLIDKRSKELTRAKETMRVR